MLSHNYSYAECLDNSVKGAWSVDDCFQGRDFDFAKRFLPDRIAGVDAIGRLTEAEKLKLNQIRGNSYCRIFAKPCLIEESIGFGITSKGGRFDAGALDAGAP